MGFQTYGSIIKSNIKHHFKIHFGVALFIACVTPMIMSVSALSETRAAKPLEMVLSLIGMILLTPVFLPEQNETIRDVVRAKSMNHIHIYIMRLVYSLFTMAAMIFFFILFMKQFDSIVTVWHFIGGFASALFLGALGFAAAGISRNISVGYMVPFLYYIANYGGKDTLGVFYLFSMSSSRVIGNTMEFQPKYYLLIVSVVIMIGTLVLVDMRDKKIS